MISATTAHPIVVCLSAFFLSPSFSLLFLNMRESWIFFLGALAFVAFFPSSSPSVCSSSLLPSFAFHAFSVLHLPALPPLAVVCYRVFESFLLFVFHHHSFLFVVQIALEMPANAWNTDLMLYLLVVDRFCQHTVIFAPGQFKISLCR